MSVIDEYIPSVTDDKIAKLESDILEIRGIVIGLCKIMGIKEAAMKAVSEGKNIQRTDQPPTSFDERAGNNE